MEKDNLNDTLEALLPKELDDIITQNRHFMQLEYASAEDLAKMHADIPITNLRGVLTQAFVYKRIVPSKNAEYFCLVGFNSDLVAFHTSEVVAYDNVNNVALTASGSHYVVESFETGAPDFNLLLHICYIFHRDGIGNYLGVTSIFY
ncbi:hypothetical protein [Methylophilus sp.]|jgi:hypothetical protein|uniref:hypothetical protein n=1 Tax=Methylophilus sp. TaxID=29541 RepID=UPI0011D42AF1|nr:hypothetical protein [Methylophilus sp.]TXI45766.1 MAG: hypothetical protein E6Q52_05130 [Methylophilus sp.]